MALIYEKRGKIAYVTINRPEVMNAMDPETYSELSQAWIDIRDDPDVWCAIITGAGDKAFSAGADLKKTIPLEPEKWRFWQTQEEQILNRGLEVWKPIIAAVNGFCLAGGMTLLLSTDLRVAVDHAKFGLSEVKRGILPGNGGTQRTIQQLPYPIAMWLLMSGEWLSAQEAQQYGLINKVVPQGELITEAERMANVICQNGPLAVRAIKELAVRGQYMPIEYGLRMEQAMGQLLRATDDAKEGPRAFAEKRKANFTGR
ncbi:MAG: enoyl-CoA hydratase/isomerase family protein [Chloroflexi bacterium]|nr:enoyl-CoA hydratase/isomerase family protein [Chloroflexota bacterium]